MNEKILIVLADDHTMMRKALVSMLNGIQECEVVGDAANGLELLALIDSLTPKPDICLLDIDMPVMNGFETLAVLKKNYPAIKVLILTQYDHEFTIIRTLRAGANGYLLKDTEPEDLRKALNELKNDTYYGNKKVKRYLSSMVRNEEMPEELALSVREQDFLRLCCSELPYKEIASRMNVSEDGANYYRKSLCAKLGVTTRTSLALGAIKLGLVLPGDKL